MVFDKLPTNHMKIIKIIALKTNISDNFQSHLKVRSKILLHWRPPEGFHFHWRGLKNRDLQFKTLRKFIYIPLEGLRYLFRFFFNSTGGIQIFSTGGSQISLQRVYNSTGIINHLDGYLNSSSGNINPLDDYLNPSSGILNTPGEYPNPSSGIINSL